MNYKLNIGAGGIFSKYMFGLQNAATLPGEQYYFNVVDERTNSNMFDYILNQSYDSSYTEISCEHLGNYSKYNLVEESINFSKYKDITRMLTFNKELLDRVEYYQREFNIDESTVGVHIRLTDMNVIHAADYGILSFDDFRLKMDSDTKYFVTSDNNESLRRLKELYGTNVNYVDNLIRCDSETGDSNALQISSFRDSTFWVEAFLEMLLLSKCGSILCRSSNLSNASIIHSKNYKNIIRI